MELKSSRSRVGSVAAGGYDELLTPLICDAQSEPVRGAAWEEDARGLDGRNSRSGGALVDKRSGRSSRSGRQVSVRSRQSIHGSEIRRQGSVGPPGGDGGGLRVKSTVSGFLNRDYYTSNDSVPLIRVSESYTRLFRHTSDEDTDSEVEEIVEKKFGTEAKNLRDALKTNFAVRKTALGIPRMEGHMRLPDRKTAHTDAKDRLYRGQCYVVELPYRLERSTRGLTRTAVGRAMEDERVRRVSELRQRGALVSELWLAVQAELRQLARDAEQEDVESTITSTQTNEDRMELVREELVQKVHRKAVRAEVAEAQQWKQMFFKGISKNKLPTDAMEAVASTSEHMNSVLQQLQEAFSCSEIEEGSRQEVIQERAQDLKDACLTELLRCVAVQKIKVEITIETERQVHEFKRGRPAAVRKSGSQEGVDLGAAKQAVGGSLGKIFKRVSDRETKKDNRVRDRVSELKTICQEEVVRKVMAKQVAVMCNHEKARRIVESEDPAVMNDPDRARIADHWVRVQAQMVVDKFMGKKPMKKTSMTEVLEGRNGSPSPIRSALDRRLKAVRERFRRPAVYFCDEDDTFIRERARRRTSLSSPSQGRLGSRSSLAHSSVSGSVRRRRSSAGGSSSPSPSRSRRATEAARPRRESGARVSPSRQPSAARSPSREVSETRRKSASRSPSHRVSETRQKSASRSPSRQPSITHSPSRQLSSSRSQPGRQPSVSRSKHQSQVVSPSRQSSAARSASKQSSVGRTASRQSSGTAASAASPRRQSSSKQAVTAKRSSRRQTSGESPKAARSASYVSARSGTSTERRPSSSRRRSNPSAATGEERSQSPPGILKNGDSSRRASSTAGSPPRESRAKVSRSSPSTARGDVGARRSGAVEPRRSPSGGGASARRGRSGGDVKEVLAPRRMESEAGGPEAASRSYRKRGDKTAEFQQERQEIADRREQEHSQRVERKRSRSAGKTSDQYRSHWTAHIQE
ncbi:uncharacterized protein LOC122388515 isoform X1 [Amphibalanus amphitrite]|uniref:uncharacterized protein LOC122388515 isoform X1 n=2 Tax=Amphibalanus amphitrite TaxID=1232801 RepID=UPI001C91C219|nr:uncharacterized protein LOC122388515 isoform X1 [Amphibalanus amphitrite]